LCLGLRDRLRCLPVPTTQFPREVVTAVCDSLEQYVAFCLAADAHAHTLELASMLEPGMGEVNATARVPTRIAGARSLRTYGAVSTQLPLLGGVLKFVGDMVVHMAEPAAHLAGPESAPRTAQRRDLCTRLIRSLSRAITKLGPRTCPEYRKLVGCASKVAAANWRLGCLFLRLLARTWRPVDR